MSRDGLIVQRTYHERVICSCGERNRLDAGWKKETASNADRGGEIDVEQSQMDSIFSTRDTRAERDSPGVSLVSRLRLICPSTCSSFTLQRHNLHGQLRSAFQA